MSMAQPVSGPGPFSQRTDQAPGQPVRVPTGLDYGSAKKLEQAQQAVPLPAGSGGVPPSPAAGPAGPALGSLPSQPMPDNHLDLLSHPTQRPNEPLNTIPPSPLGTDTLPQLMNQIVAAPGVTQDVKDLAAFVASGRR